MSTKPTPKKPAEIETEATQKRQEPLTKAEAFWDKGTPATEHPYTTKKGLEPEGLRVCGDDLLVPMFNAVQQIASVQRIKPGGKKLFMKGCPTSELYYPIGTPTDNTVVVVEGWATGMSIQLATGLAVAVAFSSGNLGKVAALMREKHPDIEVVIAPDNDKSQHAINKAEEAARKHGCQVVVPQFPEGMEGTDFDDLRQGAGLDEVKCQFDSNRSLPAAKALSEQEVVDAIRELAQLSTIAYEQCRMDAAKELGMRTSVLDREVEKLRPIVPAEDGDRFPKPESWADPVVLADLLDEIVVVIHRHVILGKPSAVAMALYVLLTYCIDEISCCPTLAIESPEKRCGKTTLLDLLMRLVYRPIPAANISPAAVYRLIEAVQPTLLIDEADTFLKDNNDIRGILNSGHTRATAVVWRTEEINGEREVVPFSTWGAKIIAQIGQLYDTLRDRSIVVSMRRKLPDESVERLRKRDYSEIPRKAYAWALENKARIPALEPETPDCLNDRQADGWEPLLAIADIAGGEWPDKARSAAKMLCGAKSGDEGIRIQLLTDLRVIFQEDIRIGWGTVDLIQKLCKRFEDHPWPTYCKGKWITSRQLAALLKPFGVKSKVERSLGSKRGYMTEAFNDPFKRYLPTVVKDTPSPSDPPFVSVTPLQPLHSNGSSDFSPVTTDDHITYEKPLKPAPALGCNTVTDREGGVEGEHIQSDERNVSADSWAF